MAGMRSEGGQQDRAYSRKISSSRPKQHLYLNNVPSTDASALCLTCLKDTVAFLECTYWEVKSGAYF